MSYSDGEQRSGATRVMRAIVATIGAFAGALLCFLVLPLLQEITMQERADLELRSADTAELPPPPPPPEEEKQEEEPEDEPPPQMAEEAPPLDLSQLELALSPSFGAGDFAGDFAVRLQGLGGEGNGVDGLFDLSDLDQKPRPIYQHPPQITPAMKKRMPGTVYVLFTVDESGVVRDPTVQSSDDPVFDQAALTAIRQWKFEPGKRRGEAVSFRMRQPMTFK
ncbi:MAG: energy transducer TonB [Planctomycetota bacterium]